MGRFAFQRGMARPCCLLASKTLTRSLILQLEPWRRWRELLPPTANSVSNGLGSDSRAYRSNAQTLPAALPKQM